MAVNSKANKPNDKGVQLNTSGDQFAITLLSEKAGTVVPSDPSGQVVFGGAGSGTVYIIGDAEFENTNADQLAVATSALPSGKGVEDYTWVLTNLSDGNVTFNFLEAINDGKYFSPPGYGYLGFTYNAFGAGSPDGAAEKDQIQLVGTPVDGDPVTITATLELFPA